MVNILVFSSLVYVKMKVVLFVCLLVFLFVFCFVIFLLLFVFFFSFKAIVLSKIVVSEW